MLFVVASCADLTESASMKYAGAFVINEVVASNHTGLTSADGNLYDWIEIKNVSEETASLSNFSLRYEKAPASRHKNPGKRKVREWAFPAIEVEAGKSVVVFASKKKARENTTELHAGFGLSADGGKLSLVCGDSVTGTLAYGAMEDDECLRRLSDGSYIKGYESTPGFDNSVAGIDSSSARIERLRKSPLRIWEFHAKGYKSGHAWVELKNVSGKPLSLKGFCLATSKKRMSEWPFPDVTLEPGGIYVVSCKKDRFKLGRHQSVMLTRGGKFADGMCGASAPFGMSVGRLDGMDGVFFFTTPTRGKENNGTHYRLVSARPTFSPSPGVYPTAGGVSVSLNTHGRKVRYTTDGSLPTKGSPLYEHPITISATTTVKAYCEGDSLYSPSPVASHTYILSEHKHDLPVVSVTVAPSDLYDYHHGIYETGPGANKEFPHMGANYWKSWWKKARVELFDGEDGFSESCQLAIFGGFSRALPKKSFKVRFMDEGGKSRLTYDYFNDGSPKDLRKFLLRSGSQDIYGVMVRDEFFTTLMAEHSPTLLTQPYRAVVLYVNGEYFGIYYIREKIDKNFVADRLGVGNDSISIVMSGKYVEEGSMSDYKQVITYAKSHNLAEQEHYDYIDSKFDLTGLIDFKLGEIYSCNTDVGNVRYVRSEDAKSDKKWHVVFYDLDATWTTVRPLTFYLQANGSESEGSVSGHNILVHKLLENSTFRHRFLERLSLHLHTTFRPDHVTEVFDSLINTIKPEMRLNCERWPSLMSYAKWESHVREFRGKFQRRAENMLNAIREYLHVTAEEEKEFFADLGY